MRILLAIILIPFVAIFEIIRGVFGIVLGLFDGLKSISSESNFTSEEMSRILIGVENEVLDSDQSRSEYVQEIADIQGGTLDRAKLKESMASLTISSLFRVGFDKDLVISNIHLVHGTVERIRSSISAELCVAEGELFDLFKNNLSEAKVWIEYFYPLSKGALADFSDNLDWSNISSNRQLPFNEELLSTFINKWNWYDLSKNPAIPWDEETISKFEEQIIWPNFSCNTGTFWSEKILEKYAIKPMLNLSSNRSIPWSEELIEKYEKSLSWGYLSRNELLPWSINFIEKYKDKWFWLDLSSNKHLPWSLELVAKFAEKWDWLAISKNESIPWSEIFLTKCEHRLYWQVVSENESIPWSEELLAKFEDRWAWDVLGFNASLPWSDKLVSRFRDRLSNFEYTNGSLVFSKEESYLFGHFGGSYKTVPWSEELIARYENKTEWWSELSGNEHIPWSEKLIARFKGKWIRHSLCANSSVPWTVDLMSKFGMTEYDHPHDRFLQNKKLMWGTDLIQFYLDKKSTPQPRELSSEHQILTIVRSLSEDQVQQIITSVTT
jgi:hypothetical protein